VETAGGVTAAAVEAARRRGVIRDGDEVVALLTGNGVKTPDARRFGVDEAEGDDIDGAAPPIAATYEAFADRYGS
jgi:threonine synthase